MSGCRHRVLASRILISGTNPTAIEPQPAYRDSDALVKSYAVAYKAPVVELGLCKIRSALLPAVGGTRTTLTCFILMDPI